MIPRIVPLIIAGLAFAALLGIPARHFGGGDVAFVHCLTAALLCLVPAVLDPGGCAWGLTQARGSNRSIALGASAGRMFFVLLAALLLYLPGSAFQHRASSSGSSPLPLRCASRSSC